jgi:hypothetical protein
VKLIGVLCDSLPHKKELIESILTHVNEVQASERHYQLHKQTKLKLIHLLSDGQSEQSPVKSQPAIA